MGTRKTSGLPLRLEATRRRFERWRRTHKGRRRIPDALWTSAVKMAGDYGMNRTAQALRVNYYSLKERLEQQTTTSHGVPEVGNLPTFFQLGSTTRADAGECLLELEDADGAKMRVHLKGVEAPDLAALSRNFWGRVS